MAQRTRILTAQELLVVESYSHGGGAAAAGARLQISPNTVKTYVGRILGKTGKGNMTEVVAMALRERWIR